jgi:hypothetical protein
MMGDSLNRFLFHDLGGPSPYYLQAILTEDFLLDR